MSTLAPIQLVCGSVVSTFEVAATLAPTVQELVCTFSIDSAKILSAIELDAAFIQH
ncbi:hypothetical protein H4R27_005048, partial [Coemansia aciculifera]